LEKVADPKLVQELKELIIEVCNLSAVDVKAEDIKDNEPLVGPGSQLELDSLDVTEIIVAVEKKYNIRVGSMNLSREIIQSLAALAQFVEDKLNGLTNEEMQAASSNIKSEI
jgi:acyl carrier protein